MRSATAFLVRFAAAGLVCLAVPAAHADDVPRAADRLLATRSVTVSWADLDLTRPAGRRELYRRIRAAAHVACTALEVDRLFEPLFAQTCFEQAVDAAVAKVPDADLAALHRAARDHSDHAGQ
jgi:UrcA family protein